MRARGDNPAMRTRCVVRSNQCGSTKCPYVGIVNPRAGNDKKNCLRVKSNFRIASELFALEAAAMLAFP